MKRIVETRIYEELSNHKALLLIGQRQVGKTTTLRHTLKYANEQGIPTQFYDFEDYKQRLLFPPSLEDLERQIGKRDEKRIVFMDEVQFLPQVGSVIKLIYDHFPETKVIATGSASFLLLKHAGDSLYGRHTQLIMYPLTLREILGDTENTSYILGQYPTTQHKLALESYLPSLLVYGSLPEVFFSTTPQEKQQLLKSYINSLLFKDIFEIEGIRSPETFRRLLLLLALQIGQEINPAELATQLHISQKTVVEYISLYEKFQIVRILPSFSNNPRKEISKGKKVYFVDLGIRNALLDAFTPLELRNDTGHLFENFMVMHLYASTDYYQLHYSHFFWRNYNKAEVDIVLKNSTLPELIPIEIKWKKETPPSQAFLNQYHDSVKSTYTITSDTLWKFL